MDPDDLDDFLDGKRADLEARFEELENEAEIDRMRKNAGAPPPRRERAAAPDGDDDKASASAGAAAGDDPLSDMKDALDGDGEMERYLLVVCPGCKAKNRMSLKKVRTAAPKCGKCKQDLSFTKF